MTDVLTNTTVDLGTEIELEDVVYLHCTFIGPAFLQGVRTGEVHSMMCDCAFVAPQPEPPTWRVTFLSCEFHHCRFENVWIGA